MWLRKKMNRDDYEDVMMDIIDKTNEIIDWIEQHEETKGQHRKEQNMGALQEDSTKKR